MHLLGYPQVLDILELIRLKDPLPLPQTRYLRMTNNVFQFYSLLIFLQTPQKAKKDPTKAPQKNSPSTPISFKKGLEIAGKATLTDINGLINDYATIDKRLYMQNFGAGFSLLNK